VRTVGPADDWPDACEESERGNVPARHQMGHVVQATISKSDIG
jgi:hypothetical protein